MASLITEQLIESLDRLAPAPVRALRCPSSLALTGGRVVTDEDIVRSYISFLEHGRQDADLPAWDHIADLLTTDPTRAWQLLQRAIELAPSDDVLESIGEDLLEDLLARHGVELVDRILADGAVNPRIATALQCTWGETRFDARVLQKVNQFLKSHD